jgi:hypothetical protein
MCIIFYHNQSAKVTFKDARLDGHAGLTGGQWDIVVLLGSGSGGDSVGLCWEKPWFMVENNR